MSAFIFENAASLKEFLEHAQSCDGDCRKAFSLELAAFQSSAAFESEKRWYDTLDAFVCCDRLFFAVALSSNALHYYIGRLE